MEKLKLKRIEKFSGRKGPLALIIMDGIGLGKKDESNAFYLANTPFLDRLQSEKKLYTTLKAHGTAVGLPSDNEMGKPNFCPKTRRSDTTPWGLEMSLDKEQF